MTRVRKQTNSQTNSSNRPKPPEDTRQFKSRFLALHLGSDTSSYLQVTGTCLEVVHNVEITLETDHVWSILRTFHDISAANLELVPFWGGYDLRSSVTSRSWMPACSVRRGAKLVEASAVFGVLCSSSQLQPRCSEKSDLEVKICQNHLNNQVPDHFLTFKVRFH